MLGYKFRRQHVIDGFIVDFYCRELKLVIELDGVGHTDPEHVDYDVARTAHLELKGLLVIRFRNDGVSEEKLRKLLEDLSYRSPSPRSGEGAGG